MYNYLNWIEVRGLRLEGLGEFFFVFFYDMYNCCIVAIKMFRV
jgi:hypothetical protein